MSESIIIRPAALADWPHVAAANAALAAESEHRTLRADLLEPGVRAVLLDANRGRYFIAEVAGAFAGQTLITFEWSDWRNGWFWWIQSVYVMPAHRRSGVFRALHAHIREAARAAGDVCGLRLYVDRDNHAAQRTYESLGMRPTAYQLLEEDWS